MVDLLDRTSSEPASYSPAPRASVDLPPVLDRDVRFGAAVYGSFLAASVIGVAYESGAGARTMTASLLGSMLVFWAAHVWSDAVGERIRLGKAFRARDMLLIARREWPLVEAAALPSILLGLAWAEAWSRETGARLALAAALVQVVTWGYAAGRRAGGSGSQPRRSRRAKECSWSSCSPPEWLSHLNSPRRQQGPTAWHWRGIALRDRASHIPLNRSCHDYDNK